MPAAGHGEGPFHRRAFGFGRLVGGTAREQRLIGAADLLERRVRPDPEDLVRAQPVYTKIPGWDKLPSDARDITDLPAPARAYVETIERMAGVPFCLVSVGPDRAETIRLIDPFS